MWLPVVIELTNYFPSRKSCQERGGAGADGERPTLTPGYPTSSSLEACTRVCAGARTARMCVLYVCVCACDEVAEGCPLLLLNKIPSAMASAIELKYNVIQLYVEYVVKHYLNC